MTPEGDSPLDARGAALLEEIVDAAGDSLDAAIFFGSRRSGLTTTSFSAYDLILSARDTRLLYERLHAAELLARSPALLALLDGLPPTQIRVPSRTGDAVVKAAVVSTRALDRATSAERRDQFLAGRLFQDVHVVWARDAAARLAVDRAIASARDETLGWVAPDLPGRFDAEGYARQLLRTSFRFEVRPESADRADAVFESQRTALVRIFERVLAGLESRGRLARNADGTWSLSPVPSRGERARRRLFLEWSRVRATLRWPKHAITFDGWLEYIVRKAERHSGQTIVLTPLERKAPFIFMWPRVIRFLLAQRRAR